MRQRKYYFKKKRSNTDSLQNLLIIISLMISAIFIFRLYLGIELIKEFDKIPKLFFDSLFFSVISAISIIFIVVAFHFFSKPWWYWLFKIRLNRLFEELGKNETLSKKLSFPKTGIKRDRKQGIFYITFYWEAKCSESVINEIKNHRLSEILFPKNNYILEEPVQTQAFTKFVYKKKPERLRIEYEK